MASKFQIKKAIRENVFVKIALMGSSGAGKSYSALKLATGMSKELESLGKPSNILFINTESSRGLYYSDEFSYDIIDLEAPFEPELFIDAINYGVSEGYGIIIVDSTSHEWEGIGGCLDIHKKIGGRAQDWARVSPRHNAFIDCIAESKVNLIATMRAKEQYEIDKDEKGKTTVSKLGMGAKQRDGFEYEFTCTFLLDNKSHRATTQKDNTHLFESKVDYLLNEQDGINITKWANNGVEPTEKPKLKPKKAESVPISQNTDKINEVLNSCKSLFKEKMSNIGKDSLYAEVESICGSKDFTKITDIDIAEKVLKMLETI